MSLVPLGDAIPTIDGVQATSFDAPFRPRHGVGDVARVVPLWIQRTLGAEQVSTRWGMVVSVSRQLPSHMVSEIPKSSGVRTITL